MVELGIACFLLASAVHLSTTTNFWVSCDSLLVLCDITGSQGTCNKSTQTENKTTQTDDSFDEYLKKQEKSTSEKTPKETPKGKQDKNASSPRPGPALKPATLEMMKKEEEKKKKEEKDKLKKQQKEERKQQWQKEQAQKEKEQMEKAKQAEMNPYSVFAEKDGEEVMDDESVVFTEPSSSDHLPKGTLSRLPLA